MEDVLLRSCHVIVEGPRGWQGTLDGNAQVFLVNSLHSWPMLCCPKGPSWFGAGLESHICPMTSPGGCQDCANAAQEEQWSSTGLWKPLQGIVCLSSKSHGQWDIHFFSLKTRTKASRGPRKPILYCWLLFLVGHSFRTGVGRTQWTSPACASVFITNYPWAPEQALPPPSFRRVPLKL